MQQKTGTYFVQWLSQKYWCFSWILYPIRFRFRLGLSIRSLVVQKCLQHLHLVALHFEILGYIPRLLNGIIYLRKMGDFRGDSLTLGLLRKTLVLAVPWRLVDDAENKFKGIILIEGSIVLKLCMERDICTEDVECNLRGDIIDLIKFVIPIKFVCKLVTTSTDEWYTYRFLILTSISVQQKVLQKEGRYNKRPQFKWKKRSRRLYNDVLNFNFSPSSRIWPLV